MRHYGTETHCAKGHEFSPENTARSGPNGEFRRCRTCQQTTLHEWRARRGIKPYVLPEMPTEPTVLAYAAGLFDGEGSVAITCSKSSSMSGKRYHALVLRVTSTDSRVIDWLLEHFGGNACIQKTPAEHKDAFNWQSRAMHAEFFLRAIRPYLIIKAAQADLGLMLRETRQVSGGARPDGRVGSPALVTPELFAYREGLRQQVMALNRRGARES